MRMTEKDLQQKLANGTIRGYTVKNIPKSTQKFPKGGQKAPKSGKNIPGKRKKRSKEKEWISKNLWYWCQEHKLEMKTEHKFHGKRKWRFDWCVKELMVAIEYNGIMSQKSRHTTITGYTGDMEKLNAAQALGWKVLQFTPLNYKDLLTELNKNL